MIRRSSRRAFFRSIGRSIGRCVRAHSYQLNWIPSCPVLPLAYIPSLDGALLPWLAVSLGESLLFSDSKHAILVRMYNRHDHHLRSRSVSSCSLVRSFVRPFVSFRSRRPSYVRPLHDKSVCSLGAQPLGCCTHRVYPPPIYRSPTSPRPLFSLESPLPSISPRDRKCTEPDSARLMPEVRFAEIGKFGCNDASTPAWFRYACVCPLAN